MPMDTANMMFIDTSKCMACKACQVSCKAWHQLPAEDTSFTGSYENPPDLSGTTYTRVTFTEVASEKWLFFKDQCRHCSGGMGAPCLKACPVRRAIVRKPSGAIVITDRCNPNRCRTRPCEDACPYNIPRYYAEINKERKCDFCFDRIASGGVPNCALTCPPGAITFGTSGYVQAVANDRLAEVLARYPDANIYPDGDGHGGHDRTQATRVIWLLVEDPSVYGL